MMRTVCGCSAGPQRAKANIAAASLTTWARPGSHSRLLPVVNAGGPGAAAAAQAEAAATAARQRKTFILISGQRPAVSPVRVPGKATPMESARPRIKAV